MLQNVFLRHLNYNQQTRRFFMTIIVAGFAIEGVYAVLFNLYLLRLGYETEFIGQVNSAGLLVFALVSLPAGLSGTRWSSSLMLRFGLGVMALVRFLQVAGLATTSIFFNVYLDTELGISPGLIGIIVATSRCRNAINR